MSFSNKGRTRTISQPPSLKPIPSQSVLSITESKSTEQASQECRSRSYASILNTSNIVNLDHNTTLPEATPLDTSITQANKANKIRPANSQRAGNSGNCDSITAGVANGTQFERSNERTRLLPTHEQFNDGNIFSSSEENEPGQEKINRLKPLTHMQLKVMVVICFINFCSCMGYTVLSTFLPIESNARGVSPSQNGLIFAIYAGVTMIGSPLFGYFMPTIGARPMVYSGLSLSAVTYVLFSLLEWEHDPNRFVVISCVIRVFTAIASSQYLTAAYAIMTHVWEERRTQAIGLIEMTTGIGMILGPIAGSALYNYGGFGLPFRVMAAIFLLGLPMVAVVIKNVDLGEKNDVMNSMAMSNKMYSGEFSDQLTFTQFLKIFTNFDTWGNIFMTVVCWASMDFIMPILQPHVKIANPGKTDAEATYITGCMFIVYAISYGLATPIIGKICTNLGTKSNRHSMSIGALIIVMSYLFMGPNEKVARGLGWEKFSNNDYIGNNISITIMFAILGVGVALISVPSVDDLVQCAYKVGFPREGIATISVVIGFYNCMLFLGEFIGPLLAGLFWELYQTKKLPETDVVSKTYSTFASTVELLSITSGIFYFAEWVRDKLKEKANKTNNNSYKPLTDDFRKSYQTIQKDYSCSFNKSGRQRDDKIDRGSIVMGPQSFSLSCSYKRR